MHHQGRGRSTTDRGGGGCALTHLRAPTTGEKDACLEALMEQQDWDENPAYRWRETSGAVIQNGAVGENEPGTVSDAQQVTQTLSPPTRVKAALSNLRQGLPTGLPQAKSPPPIDSGRILSNVSRLLSRKREGLETSSESHSVQAISVRRERSLNEISSTASEAAQVPRSLDSKRAVLFSGDPLSIICVFLTHPESRVCQRRQLLVLDFRPQA